MLSISNPSWGNVSSDRSGYGGVITYDALGRRIRKVIADLGGGNGGLTGDIPAGTTDYLYDGVQCIEERDDSNDAIRQYVWGQYVDELIQQRDINGSDVDYYMLSDLLYRAAELRDDAGTTTEESYDGDAYGNTQIFNSGSTRIYDPLCQFIFTGRRFDPETSNATTQIYFYRARYYSPTLGRFISRDPIGYEDSMNLYEYVGGEATDAVDPMGLTKACALKQCYELGNRYAKLENTLKALRHHSRELGKMIPDHSRKIAALRRQLSDLNTIKERHQNLADRTADVLKRTIGRMHHYNKKASGLTNRAGVIGSLSTETGVQVARYGGLRAGGKVAAYFVPGLNVASTLYGIYSLIRDLSKWVDVTECKRKRDVELDALNSDWFTRKMQTLADARDIVAQTEKKGNPLAADLLGLVLLEKAAKAEYSRAGDELRTNMNRLSKVFRLWKELGCETKVIPGTRTYLSEFATAQARGKPLVYKGD
jgi:RHS repeat-associated protein